MRWSLLFALCVVACGGKSTSDTGDTSTTTDTGPTMTQLPPDPTPIALSISGDQSGSFSFTQGDCTHYTGSSDFRERWHDLDTNWVLTLSITGHYDGVGQYDQTTGAEVTLAHSVALGEYYDSNTGTHTVSADVTFDDGTGVAGQVTVDGLTDVTTSNQITLSPSTVPIWCQSVIH